MSWHLFGSAGIYGAQLLQEISEDVFYSCQGIIAAVEVTESIINTFPQYSYTIVSPKMSFIR